MKEDVVDQILLRSSTTAYISAKLLGHIGQLVTRGPLGGEPGGPHLENAPSLEHVLEGEAVQSGKEPQRLAIECWRPSAIKVPAPGASSVLPCRSASEARRAATGG